VIFNKDLTVRQTKILAYREEYGGEIGSKRWLSQFDGKSGDETLEYQKNIDAISGATISARSMTMAMNNLLKTINTLKQKHIFDEL
jgi:Na+-translocating ferredoxin:NAD+ oxidoreductase RnfG subunit